jgi:predicted GIY-YIG superfamily endonuclease
MTYTVYKIEIDGIIRYIGHTNNIKRRQTQHNYLFKKGKKKELYDNITDKSIRLVLTPLREFKSKVEAKRWECLLVLQDHFSDKSLWQKPPQIKDM